MLNCDCHCRLAVKRNPPREHFKHGDSQRINIAFFIAISAPCLFWRGIVDGSHHIGGNGITGGCLGNTKVRHLYLPIPGDNNILRLDIPMNNMIVMGSLNSHTNLYRNADCLFKRQPRLFFNIFFERDPFHQLHYNIIDIIFFANIIHVYYIGVHQPCRRLCFRAEL